ncbi:tyrosine-type recombinase/integrase [Streptosporangium roseum]|uniref:Integrase family protein n=1 Tax=Streptosporangium roseum (strain ATCC 12428 / DSM 43021 / JCM 3005 / KCTC 9067 / NCIMB 10171 / NRRL 2505 / NI 9100) TaxID=479432 RepID=D2B1M3_STRRD|nr:tyrosine-type recombinase/integrase [Streptosporangium roseum]ACZ87325.1 integrase family protein [Streptosporangium roseum DSM 43021]
MSGGDRPVPVGLSEVVAEFLSALRTKKLSSHTVAGYRRDLELVAGLAAAAAGVGVADLEVRSLSGRLVRTAFAEFSGPRSPASVNRAWSAWNQFLSFCVAEGLLEGNPMAAVPRPKQPAKAPKPLLGDGSASATLLERIAAGARRARDPWVERDLVVLALALVTGMRSAELLGLTLGSIGGSPGDRRIQVVGKGGRSRSLPIEAPVERLVERYLHSRMVRFGLSALPRSAALLVDTGNEPLRRGGLQYLVRQCYRHAGVHDRVQRGTLVHALRHEFATRLAERGASAHELMELLGHSSIVTGQAYIASTAREVRRAAQGNPAYGVLERLGPEGGGGAAG